MSQRQVTVVPFKGYLLDVASWCAVQDGTVDPSGTDDYAPPQPPLYP
jgi:hypothetical protein